MKKLVFFSVIMAMVFSSCNNNSDLVGEWVTEDRYDSEKIIFKDDGSIILLKNNKIDDMGISGISMSYDTDRSKTPHNIDFVLSETESKEEVVRIKGIYELLSDNTMRICFNDFSRNEKALLRPKEFDTDNTKIFTRNK